MTAILRKYANISFLVYGTISCSYGLVKLQAADAVRLPRKTN